MSFPPEINYYTAPVPGTTKVIMGYATAAPVASVQINIESDEQLLRGKLQLKKQLLNQLYFPIFSQLHTALETIKSDPTAGLRQLVSLHQQIANEIK